MTNVSRKKPFQFLATAPLLILEELAQCKKGKGLALINQSRRDASVLVRRGFVEYFEAVGIRVYTITAQGRAYLAGLLTEEREVLRS